MIAEARFAGVIGIVLATLAIVRSFQTRTGSERLLIIKSSVLLLGIIGCFLIYTVAPTRLSWLLTVGTVALVLWCSLGGRLLEQLIDQSTRLLKTKTSENKR